MIAGQSNYSVEGNHFLIVSSVHSFTEFDEQRITDSRGRGHILQSHFMKYIVIDPAQFLHCTSAVSPDFIVTHSAAVVA